MVCQVIFRNSQDRRYQWPYTSVQFFNNPRLVQERAVKCIAKDLASTSTYTDLRDGIRRSYTCGVVYRTDT